MSNITNQLGYVTNTQFSGGEPVTPLSGSEFAWQNRGYGGLYVGTPGTLSSENYKWKCTNIGICIRIYTRIDWSSICFFNCC